MGRGNYLPYHKDYELWYIDNDAIHAIEEEEDSLYVEVAYSFFVDDLIREVQKVIPSMRECRKRYLGNHESVIAENKFATLSIADNENSTAVIISIDPDNPTFGLGARWLSDIAPKVQEQLLKTWKGSLRKRTSAWTSETI
jgi:hypothetical protein